MDVAPAPGTDFKGGVKKTGVMLILHELAHKLRLIPSDGGNRSQSIANSQTIIKECKAQLNQIP